MKRFLPFLLTPFIVDAVHAQNALTITPGTSLYINSSNTLNIEGLSLTPSAPFTISGAAVAKNSTVTNAGLSNTVSRAYLFSTATAPFSGAIRFYYRDGERGSLNESSLDVQTYNGSSWQPLSATTRDAVSNYIEVTGVANRSFSEVALNVNTILPLTWKQVEALRQENNIMIRWTTGDELNVSQFFVQRSLNDGSWQTVADNIKADNTLSGHQCEYIDAQFTTGKPFYRIGQTDLDGHVSYSKIVTPGALDIFSAVRLYPNPAASTFSVQMDKPGDVKEIRLYSLSGGLVQKWQAPQASYSIQHLPPGAYQLCVVEKDGDQHFLPLIKN